MTNKRYTCYTGAMKIIVTHLSPDLDAIASVWIIKKFLPGWKDALVEFVPAGNRMERVKNNPDFENEAIILHAGDEIMHVDTGMGPLDHHQTSDQNVCGASRCWDYVQAKITAGQPMKKEHIAAVSRIIKIIVEYDQFLEVYRPDAAADWQEFSLFGITEGLQYLRPGEDAYYVDYGRTALDYLQSYFENKVWAENEMAAGVAFETRFGKAIGLETVNESVVKLAQKKGYVLVARKDPRRGHVSIKTRPNNPATPDEKRIDLTLAAEQFRKMDPDATWFLHVSKKMLLNGSTKNPKMVPTKLGLEDIIKVLKSIYT
jgi:hypothetical protein